MAESSTATQQLPSTSSYSLNVSPILADIRVENLSAQENSSTSSSSSSTQTTSNSNNNTNQAPPTTTTATVSLIPSSSSNNLSSAAQVVVVTTNSSITDSNTDNLDEPEAKRKKFDHPLRLKKNEKLDKLENRLGSVLCCAVCLDLPKTAMYQVNNNSDLRTFFVP